MPIRLSEIVRKNDIQVLTFEETGKAVRLLLPVYGKIAQSLNVLYINKLQHIPLCKRVNYDFFYYSSDKLEREKSDKKYQTCRKILDDNNIYYWHSERSNGCGNIIHLHTEISTFLASFSASDDPEVWRNNQKKLEDAKKISKVIRKLDKVD